MMILGGGGGGKVGGMGSYGEELVIGEEKEVESRRGIEALCELLDSAEEASSESSDKSIVYRGTVVTSRTSGWCTFIV